MKHAIAVLVFTFFIIWNLAGSEVILGTYAGYNGPEDSPCPYGNYTVQERDQYLFTAAELTAAGGSAGEILALSVYVESVNGCQPLNRFSIALGHTTLSQFGNEFLDDVTYVLTTNPYQPVPGWNRHSFATPFTWDGTSNLVIQAGYRIMNTTSANPGVHYANTSPYVRTLYQTGGVTGTSQSFHRPRIKLTMNPVTLPLTQNFDGASFPAGWTQAHDNNTPTNDWSIDDYNTSGGTPNEATWSMSGYAGSSRLISPLVKLDGVSELQVSFRHGYIAYSDQPGLVVRLEYSHDLITWQTASWYHNSERGMASGLVYALIANPTQPYLYLGWNVYNPSNLDYCDYWAIDEVSVAQAPEHDIWTIGIDGVNEVVNWGQTVAPQARVVNVGSTAENFQMQLSYSTTYQHDLPVLDLLPGEERFVSFPSFIPASHQAGTLSLIAGPATDQNIQNNTATRALYSIDLNKQAYAYAHNDNSAYYKNVTFNLAHPEIVTELAQNPVNVQPLACADWINGDWCAAEYDTPGGALTDRLWELNPATGEMTEFGHTGVTMMVGLAWDPASSTLYGVSNSNLYRLNRITGSPTLVGALGLSISVLGIAFDNHNGILYAVGGGITQAALYTLNTSTGAATLVGPLGKWLSAPGAYADCAFDQDNGYLYLCARGGSWNSNLFYIDTNNGSAWKVGYFPHAPSPYWQRSYTGFAIPYTYLAPPQVSIAGNGTLSWPPVPSAQYYTIYAADFPGGTYNFLAGTTALTWTDPDFNQHSKRFYRVRSSNSPTRQPIIYDH